VCNIKICKKLLVGLEGKLGFWKRKKQQSGDLVGVCQMPSGTSVACVQRGKDGLPVLQQLNWEPFVSAEARLESLKALARQERLLGNGTVAVLPPDSYDLMQVELAQLPDDERRDAARWQIREMLEFPVEQAVVDVFDVAPFGSDKKPLTYVVAARDAMLRERLNLLEETELLPVAIDIPEFALRNLAELFVEDDRGTAILFLQEQGGLLTIVRDGVHYLTRYLSSGMNDLVPYADGDLEALTEQLDSIVLEIQRTFDYCESTFHLPMVSRLLVAQTGREIAAVITYLNDYLTTRVEPLSFDSVLTVPEGIEQLELNRHLLAIGGALRQEDS
jgi:MSHA biogenesis protein MshI